MTTEATGANDLPLEPRSREEVKTIDTLEVAPYANGLADFVWRCATPMTIAVQGDWGSGKTSLMHLARVELNEEHRTEVLFFNTWQFAVLDGRQDLVLSLMEAMARSLEGADGERTDSSTGPSSFTHAVRSLYKGYRTVVGNPLLRSLVTPIDVAGAATEVAEGLWARVNPAEAPAEDAPQDAASAVVEIKEAFRRAVEAYCTEHGTDRLVIMIDDLDRVEPAKAVELMEALKNFFDVEQCVFVLAIDFDVVVRGVVAKYGEGFAAEKSKAYFDKIIQVPFRMPSHEAKIGPFMQKNFERLNLSAVAGDVDFYQRAAALSVGSNPRALKRVINTFQLILGVQKNLNVLKGHEEVGLADDTPFLHLLFLVVCAQEQYRAFYRELVTGLHLEDDLEGTDNIEALFERIRTAGEVTEDEDTSGTDQDGEVSDLQVLAEAVASLRWGSREDEDWREDAAAEWGVPEHSFEAFRRFVKEFSDATRTEHEIDVTLLRRCIDRATVTAIDAQPDTGAEQVPEAETVDAETEQSTDPWVQLRYWGYSEDSPTYVALKAFDDALRDELGEERPYVIEARADDPGWSFYVQDQDDAGTDAHGRMFLRLRYTQNKGFHVYCGQRAGQKDVVPARQDWAPAWDEVRAHLVSAFPGRPGPRVDSAPRPFPPIRVRELGLDLADGPTEGKSSVERAAEVLVEVYQLVAGLG